MVVIYPDINSFSNLTLILIIIVIVLLQLRQRRMKPLALFIMPIIMFAITLMLVQNVAIASLLNFSLIFIGFIIGLVLGVVVGSRMIVKINEEDGTLMVKGSFLAVGLWILIIVIKFYGREVLGSTGYFDLSVLTSIFLMLTLGAMISRRVFIYLKYRKMKVEIKENT